MEMVRIAITKCGSCGTSSPCMMRTEVSVETSSYPPIHRQGYRCARKAVSLPTRYYRCLKPRRSTVGVLTGVGAITNAALTSVIGDFVELGSLSVHFVWTWRSWIDMFSAPGGAGSFPRNTENAVAIKSGLAEVLPRSPLYLGSEAERSVKGNPRTSSNTHG